MKAHQWYTVEVIAVRFHILVKFDGGVVAEATDVQETSAKGPIALVRAVFVGDSIRFRQIEIKELPPDYHPEH